MILISTRVFIVALTFFSVVSCFENFGLKGPLVVNCYAENISVEILYADGVSLKDTWYPGMKLKIRRESSPIVTLNVFKGGQTVRSYSDKDFLKEGLGVEKYAVILKQDDFLYVDIKQSGSDINCGK